ncbi:dihydrofolate reductase family protein [Kribbella sp. NBC_01484]|uniref:dihydrofolate reductase family protein n=1 Tax=Kribbella sp. NBC_01484 TaxID=2903579 RepID=UPI002E347AF9|nr:dihydrofolate reductase family protein [Kribbella sp. NBC_01484]
MGEITVVCSLTLDGVMQGPGRVDEDVRGGFQYGGWGTPYSEDSMGRVLQRRAGVQGGMLLGRRTYEDFAGFWPKQEDNPYTDALNKQQKYVVSSTLTDPDWVNTHVIGLDGVAKLKSEQNLIVLGSGELVRSIPELIDVYILLIHPLVLGTGRHLFGNLHQPLTLTHSETTTTGVVIAEYKPGTVPSNG